MLSKAMLASPPCASVPDHTTELRSVQPAPNRKVWKSGRPPAPSLIWSSRKSVAMVPPPDRLPTTWMARALGNGPSAVPTAAAALLSHISAPSNDRSEKVPPPASAMVTGPAKVGASSAAYCVPFDTQPPNPQEVGELMMWK